MHRRAGRADGETGVGTPVARRRVTPSPPPGNLPARLSSFVGRHREVEEATALLAKNRLVTLVGPGGFGKTRLALAVAPDWSGAYPDGTWWVPLASLWSEELVPNTVARAVQAPEAPGVSRAEALVDHLRLKRALLVLDNCEHLIDACAQMAEFVLERCPDVRILATSREGLGIVGEVCWSVPPLALPAEENDPAAATVGRSEAVRLFCERAAAASPGFELTEANSPVVAKLCRGLDGVPLALELAAARVKGLGVAQIADRLADPLTLLTGGGRTASPRQRTLRATLDWSYELLSAEERRLYAWLSIFSGGWTLDAAEAVAGLAEAEVLNTLTRLIEKSLVLVEADSAGEVRYRMLEPVRQHAREMLDTERGAEEARQRHAEHFLAVSEDTPTEKAQDEAVRLARLRVEHDNLTSALKCLLGEPGRNDAGAQGLRLATALSQAGFWAAFGGPGEGRRWLERGLEVSRNAPAELRGHALIEAGFIAMYEADFEGGTALFDKARTVFREANDASGQAISLGYLGLTLTRADDVARISELWPEAEKLLAEVTHPHARATLLFFLGTASINLNEHARAEELLAECRAINIERDDKREIARCLTVSAINALDRRDLDAAARLYEEDLRIVRVVQDMPSAVYALDGVASLAALRGTADAAARLAGASAALREAFGIALSPFDRSHPDYDALQAATRSVLSERSWEAARLAGSQMSVEEAIGDAAAQLKALGQAAAKPQYPAGLSAREVEVLRLVSAGLTNAQIGEELFISPRTVNAHLGSIYGKLELSSRTEATRFAVEHGLA